MSSSGLKCIAESTKRKQLYAALAWLGLGLGLAVVRRARLVRVGARAGARAGSCRRRLVAGRRREVVCLIEERVVRSYASECEGDRLALDHLVRVRVRVRARARARARARVGARVRARARVRLDHLSPLAQVHDHSNGLRLGEREQHKVTAIVRAPVTAGGEHIM